MPLVYLARKLLFFLYSILVVDLDGTDSLLISEASDDVFPVGGDGAVQAGVGNADHVPHQSEVEQEDQGAVPDEVDDWQAGHASE